MPEGVEKADHAGEWSYHGADAPGGDVYDPTEEF